MQIDFDKHRFVGAFPEHVREECLQAFEDGKQDQHHASKVNVALERDRRAEEIWDDGAQKAEWTYTRNMELIKQDDE